MILNQNACCNLVVKYWHMGLEQWSQSLKVGEPTSRILTYKVYKLNIKYLNIDFTKIMLNTHPYK